jgi:cell division protein FtsB
MSTTEYVLGSFLFFVAVMLGFTILLLKGAKKHVAKLEKDLAERNATMEQLRKDPP